MQGVKDSKAGNHVACRRKTLWVEEEGQARHLLCQRPTIDALPDNVLLETFEFYLGKDGADEIDNEHNYDGWQTLVQVCPRWRCIVFASPRRLDVKIYCTRRRSVNSEILDIWPTLPIVVVARDIKYKEDVTNIVAALRQHDRVCKVDYHHGQFQESLLKEFAAIDGPFPALTSLNLISFAPNVPVLPDSFLGGSAPRLRSLHLIGIPYPSIGKLLLSTTNLVQLSFFRAPFSGYIAPETIVPCLSGLPRLESLILGFRSPRFRAHRASRYPPPLTRVAFPNLTYLGFDGDIEYLEDILSQIETPMLNQSQFWFLNQLVFDTPLLGHFIRRTEAFRTIHTARIEFSSFEVGVILLGGEKMANDDGEALRLEISCNPLDWQLSAIAQVLNSFLSSLPTLHSLEIVVSRKDWRCEIEVIQWREFLLPFTSVKDMTLEFKSSVRLVAPALQDFTSEGTTEVLPALQNLLLRTYDWQPSGPANEAIGRFIAARQLYGHPVTVVTVLY